MTKNLFLQYAKCSTCQKARKWLIANQIEHVVRDITTDNPSSEELSEWIDRSGVPINKWFNTSGVRYRELNLKDRISLLSREELIELLASDGKLVKRPIFIAENVAIAVVVGFKEEEWKTSLSILSRLDD